MPQLREEYGAPRLLAQVEKAIAMVPWAAERVQALRSRMPGMRERILKAEKS